MFDTTATLSSLLPHVPAVAFAVGIAAGATLLALVLVIVGTIQDRRRMRLSVVSPAPLTFDRRVATAEELARLRVALAPHHFGQDR